MLGTVHWLASKQMWMHVKAPPCFPNKHFLGQKTLHCKSQATKS